MPKHGWWHRVKGYKDQCILVADAVKMFHRFPFLDCDVPLKEGINGQVYFSLEDGPYQFFDGRWFSIIRGWEDIRPLLVELDKKNDVYKDLRTKDSD